MGISDWIRRNGDIVQKIFGSLDDIVVKSNSPDAFKELAKYENRYKDWLNLRSMNKKLSGYQMGEDDINGLVKSKYSYNPGFEEDDNIKSSPMYQEYQKAPTGDYLSYLQSGDNSDELNRLKGLGYLNEELIQPSQGELSEHIAKKLLSPEEQGVYGRLKGMNFDPVMNNLELKDLVVRNKRNLTSSGPLGSDLADELIQRAGLIQMPEEQGPKIKTEISGGFLLRYDDEGNILKKTKIDDLPPKEKNTVQKYSKMGLEEAEQLTDNELSGDAFFYLPKETQTALMQRYPALQQMHDAKFKEGDFAPKIGKFGFKGDKTNFADKTAENLGKDLFKIRKQMTGEGGYEKSGYKLQKEHDDLVQLLKNYGVNDYISWTDDIGSGKKLKDAKQTQKEFQDDYNEVINGSGGIYQWLMQMYNIDTSKTGNVELLQKNTSNLEDYVNSLSKESDYSLGKAVYDYVNSELGKLYQSKGLEYK